MRHGAMQDVLPNSDETSSVVLQVTSVTVVHRDTGLRIVRDASFAIREGEILGLVGESGSGKSTLGFATMGYFRRGLTLAAGDVHVSGRSLIGLSRKEQRRTWGSSVAYVAQDPTAALDPAMRTRNQLTEALRVHGWSKSSIAERLPQLLTDVGLTSASDRILRSYPHELSGGQQQRVLLAMALACRPAYVIFDEPTTGLDVSTQARVLETIRNLSQSHGLAGLFISHDIQVVQSLCDRIVVLHDGEVVESGEIGLLDAPAHPYTKRLVRSSLYGKVVASAGSDERSVDAGGSAPEERHQGSLGASFAAHEVPKNGSRRPRLLLVKGLNASYGDTPVLQDVDLEISDGECLALVGESGSGKTTLSRCIAGLHAGWTGQVSFEGRPLANVTDDRPASVLSDIQYVFQNPYSSLNPRRTILQALSTPAAHIRHLTSDGQASLAHETLNKVRLGPEVLQRRPTELSGGQCQRVAIARALAADPHLIICDEITSSLDAEVAMSILDLLTALRRTSDLGLLFVTHDIRLAATISDRVMVLHRGTVIETGPTERVLRNPEQPYTQELCRFHTAGYRFTA